MKAAAGKDLVRVDVPIEVAELLADLGVIKLKVRPRKRGKRVRLNIHDGIDVLVPVETMKALDVLKLRGTTKHDAVITGIRIVYMIAISADSDMLAIEE